MTAPLPILARVRHAMRLPDHDRWEGIVIERTTIENQQSLHTIYKVRWISPDGNPSDAATTHERRELVVIDPPSPPAPMNTPHASSP